MRLPDVLAEAGYGRELKEAKASHPSIFHLLDKRVIDLGADYSFDCKAAHHGENDCLLGSG